VSVKCAILVQTAVLARPTREAAGVLVDQLVLEKMDLKLTGAVVVVLTVDLPLPEEMGPADKIRLELVEVVPEEAAQLTALMVAGVAAVIAPYLGPALVVQAHNRRFGLRQLAAQQQALAVAVVVVVLGRATVMVVMAAVTAPAVGARVARERPDPDAPALLLLPILQPDQYLMQFIGVQETEHQSILGMSQTQLSILGQESWDGHRRLPANHLIIGLD
jgi:hypothetical protein